MQCSILFYFCHKVAKAEGEGVAINETNFPDKVFREYVSLEFDMDSDGVLSKSELELAEDICISPDPLFGNNRYPYLLKGNIKNLKGIEYFTNLDALDCSNNKLSVLDVSQNTVLRSLICQYNQLTNINLGQNTVLVDLYCAGNLLLNLDVSQNTSLGRFSCYSNQLYDIDLSQNKELWLLECCYNRFSVLDLSNNENLVALISGNDELSKIQFNIKAYDNEQLLQASQLHYNCTLGGNFESSDLQDLQNIISTPMGGSYAKDSILKVIDPAKPATYKVKGKEFTITYVDTSASQTPTPTPVPAPSDTPDVTPTPVPSGSPVTSSAIHIFSDYNYNNLLTGSAIVVYGNGANLTVDGKKVNNKVFTVYTDILASYKYTLNSKGVVKPSVGKVIVGITKSNVKPEVDSKNKITDKSASKIAKATIKNGQIKITALGKEGGLVYLWVIDTGNKGVSECYPVDVKVAPKKLEVQDTSGSKLTNTKLGNGKTLDVCVAGIMSGSVKTDDCTYTATVDPKYQNYITVTPVTGNADKFTIEAKGLNNNKDTKAAVTFKCDQNGKKVKFSLTVTK